MRFGGYFMNEQKLDVIMMLISAIGIFDSLYLVNEHYENSGVCYGDSQSILGYKIDCGVVTTSEYSEILGVPVSLIGFFYYLTVFILVYTKSLLNIKLKQRNLDFSINQVIFAIVTLGLIFSIYFVYLQLIVIELICIYCMLSAITTSVLLILAILLQKV